MATRVLTGGAEAVQAYTGAQTSVLQPAGTGGPPPREQPPGPRRSALPWLLVLFLLLVSAAVGYVVYQQISGSGVTVPQLSGSCDHAKAQLAEVGLRGQCKGKKSSLTQKDQVIGSDPSSGSSADKNSVVTVFIGAGPSAVAVPDVRGKSLFDAQAALQDKGFQVDATTIPVNTAKLQENQVVGTIPKAGSLQPQGTVIQLQVATGNVLVPDVTGLSCDEATAKLKQKTLVAACQDSPSDQPQGQAFQTQPAIGSPAPQNSTVSVLISSGPQQVTVPPVTNIDKNEAIHTLHDAGLKAAITQQVECTDPTLNNIVQSQDPAPGAQVADGSSVSIVVLKFRPNDPSCVSPPPT
jgi:serine/threonine-protein kinase